MLHHSRAPVDAGSRGYELLLEDGRVAFGLHHMWPGNSLKVATNAPLAIGQWVHVAVTYDGSSRASGVRFTSMDVPLRSRWFATVSGRTSRMVVSTDLASATVSAITASRGDGSTTSGFSTGRHSARSRTHGRPPRPGGSVCRTPSSTLSSDRREALLDLFLATASAPARKWTDELHALRQEQSRLINPIPEAMVMKELPTPRSRPSCSAAGPTTLRETRSRPELLGARSRRSRPSSRGTGSAWRDGSFPRSTHSRHGSRSTGFGR